MDLAMKIPFLEMFLDYLMRKFDAWLDSLNQVETERQKQDDESEITQQQSDLAKESDEAADEIDHLLE